MAAQAPRQPGPEPRLRTLALSAASGETSSIIEGNGVWKDLSPLPLPQSSSDWWRLGKNLTFPREERPILEQLSFFFSRQTGASPGHSALVSCLGTPESSPTVAASSSLHHSLPQVSVLHFPFHTSPSITHLKGNNIIEATLQKTSASRTDAMSSVLASLMCPSSLQVTEGGLDSFSGRKRAF